MRRLKGSRNMRRFAGCAIEHPVGPFAESLTGVREDLLLEDGALSGENTGLRGRETPVKATKEGRLTRGGPQRLPP